MSGVRYFVEADIPAVANLHRMAMGGRSRAARTLAQYRTYLQSVFLIGPSPSSEIRSLVFETSDGRIVGFVGIVPVSYIFKDKRIHVARVTQFCVDPNQRGMVGLQLIKRALEGPQELALSDRSNESSRRLWEWAGGKTLPERSLRWLRVFQPFRYLGDSTRRGSRVRWLTITVKPLLSVIDLCARKMTRSRMLEPEAVETLSGELTPEIMDANLPEMTAGLDLYPDYHGRELSWHLSRARNMAAWGDFKCVSVRCRSGEMLGWFVYYQSPGRVSEVLQLAARPKDLGRVVDHLFYAAWRARTTAITGTLELAALEVFARRRCFFTAPSNTVVYSRDSELLTALERRSAFISRLEGEWCLRFS